MRLTLLGDAYTQKQLGLFTEEEGNNIEADAKVVHDMMIVS